MGTVAAPLVVLICWCLTPLSSLLPLPSDDANAVAHFCYHTKFSRNLDIICMSAGGEDRLGDTIPCRLQLKDSSTMMATVVALCARWRVERWRRLPGGKRAYACLHVRLKEFDDFSQLKRRVSEKTCTYSTRIPVLKNYVSTMFLSHPSEWKRNVLVPPVVVHTLFDPALPAQCQRFWGNGLQSAETLNLTGNRINLLTPDLGLPMPRINVWFE